MLGIHVNKINRFVLVCIGHCETVAVSGLVHRISEMLRRHIKLRKVYLFCKFMLTVGPFQSDALLVPELCIFDHIHNSSLCTSHSEWNKTSVQSCVGRNMVQQSFAMLQPCGIDRFNGVEFVCCPPPQRGCHFFLNVIFFTSVYVVLVSLEQMLPVLHILQRNQ